MSYDVMAGIIRFCRGRTIALGSVFFLTLSLSGPACRLPPPSERASPAVRGEPGLLRLRSNPSGARLTLDGEPTQLRTPTLVSGLNPGRHTMTISLPGFRPWYREVVMEPGETVNLEVRLEPIATGSISLSSVPFQSWITIDGKPIPRFTPTTIEDLPVGTHTVLLRREGYEDWSHAVVVRENRQLQLNASLKPVRGVRGNLHVKTHPVQTEVIIDGYPTGSQSPATIFNLPVGRHTVQLKKAGYHTWSGEVTIRELATSNLLVTLRRSQPVLWGAALITSVPPGADLILDSVKVHAATPVSFQSITHGTHSVRLEKEGFMPWEGEIIVRPGEKTELSVSLKAVVPGEGLNNQPAEE